MSCLSAQPETIWEKIFCLLTLSCLDILKEGRIPSLDLVLLSRDSTMGKIYSPRPPVGVDLLPVYPLCGTRARPARCVDASKG